MGVLADPAGPCRCGEVRQRVEAAQAADPVTAEADDVGDAGRDQAQHLGLAAEALVGAEGRRHRAAAGPASAEAEPTGTGASTKSMPKRSCQRSMQPHRLGDRPGLVGVDADLAARDRRPRAAAASIASSAAASSADLQVEAAVAARDAVAALGRDLVRRAAARDSRSNRPSSRTAPPNSR